MTKWIYNEYGDVFLEGLPPGLPPERRVEHKITLCDPNLPSPFRGIFRLSQLELQELRKQLQTSDQRRKGLTINKSIWCTCSVCEEERRRTTNVH